jgi:pyruvate dehydrogenase E2 component (dihydrolipoamide acetyltransferase)
MALRDHPGINATVDEETGELLVWPQHDVGIAVQTPEGLTVPVLRGVEKRGLLDLAREVDRLANGARAGTLARSEMMGGTFTITSLGNLGGVMATPILNTPQVAVLGVHHIAQRPVVRDDRIVSRHVANISLTLDHRYVDGYAGAVFARDLRALLEDPAVMLFSLAELREDG